MLRVAAAKVDFRPNSEHCLVFLDPMGHLFCLTTLDETGLPAVDLNPTDAG